ncbi:ABC transporter permease [Ensifer adhaerens]|uniref:ABC transporter permease n=1 Tax=Ensifer adhaerens TaxID=106592 RepID=UPI001CBC4356|nr:ABC transporter permease [Ensifer adhaerens]MBZ7927733.1 ABC transporter permease [Ensifer adhaerens]UAX96624.1 ABC transporter permease [Ensifer adhaerens]UAY04032.1 ABC transporter permease [Ensifer adhaerens]UAY12018.1 ABC transporter permease [Ensifer adhaerens]
MKNFESTLIPIAAGLIFLGLWQWAVTQFDVPHYVLPAPTAILQSFWENRLDLLCALGNTAIVTLSAFVLALISGVALGTLMTQSRLLEQIFWPYAVVLQVTPIVAVAPLVIIWVGLSRVWLALLILAWLVAFFPMLSNTVVGIKSTEHGLRNLFTLYGASRWDRLWRLQLPGALPFILAGARISAGLSVIGAVVAEFVASSGTSTGLAWTIVQSGSMLDVPRMFAALFLLSAFGITIWQIMTIFQTLLLSRWHESEVSHEL